MFLTLTTRKRPFILFFLLASLAWVALVAIGVSLASKRQENLSLEELKRQSEMTIRELETEIEKNIQLLQYSVSLLSRESQILHAVARENARPGLLDISEEARRALFEKQTSLRHLNADLRDARDDIELIENIWVMRHDGVTIASSNADAQNCLVGMRAHMRQYFIDAIAGKKGYQFARGAGGTPSGFYFSAPVYQDSKVIGVVASKVNLATFRAWPRETNGLLIDRYDVIIKSNNPQYEMMALEHSTVHTLSEEQLLYRYGITEFPVLSITEWDSTFHPQIMKIGSEDTPYLMSSSRLMDERLRSVVMTDISAVLGRATSWNFLAVVTGCGILFLLALTCLYYYYNRLQVLQRKSAISIQTINREKAHADRYRSQFAIAHINLDNFSTLNYNLTDQTANEILLQMEMRIQNAIHDVGQLLLSERDMFVVLIKDIRQRPDIGVIVERIQSAVSQALDVHGTDRQFTATLGIAVYPADAQTAEEMLACANLALRSVMGTRPGGHAFYRPEMSQNLQSYYQMISEMKQSLEDRDFFLVYQPQLSLITGKVIGCEALVRWKHPVRGIVSPAEFIPIAESTGFIHDLGPWILDEANRQFSDWKDRLDPNFAMSVNISPEQFLSDDLLEQVKDVLLRHHISPGELQMEITETQMMSDPERTHEIIREFHKLGLLVSIDDFGTGYSSLAYLRKFEANTLKIDRAFIKELVTNAADQAVVHAIINLARSLDYKVLAEGVETNEQLRMLIDMGCHAVQGFYFSRPLEPDDFMRFYLQAKSSGSFMWSEMATQSIAVSLEDYVDVIFTKQPFEIPNPFSGFHVSLEVQVSYNSTSGEPDWTNDPIWDAHVTAEHRLPEDTIVLQARLPPDSSMHATLTDPRNERHSPLAAKGVYRLLMTRLGRIFQESA